MNAWIVVSNKQLTCRKASRLVRQEVEEVRGWGMMIFVPFFCPTGKQSKLVLYSFFFSLSCESMRRLCFVFGGGGERRLQKTWMFFCVWVMWVMDGVHKSDFCLSD